MLASSFHSASERCAFNLSFAFCNLFYFLNLADVDNWRKALLQENLPSRKLLSPSCRITSRRRFPSRDGTEVALCASDLSSSSYFLLKNQLQKSPKKVA